MALLEARGLAKTFGRRRVVNGVDLEVDEQEIVGLLGPNGAGKTTCFRMMCGLLEPNEGRVFLGDREVTNWPMYRRCRDGHMGYLAQESSVFRKLSVEQNLLAVMELLGMGRRERRLRCSELLDQFEISHLRKARAAKLSGGERRRLEIARCLVSNPEIIMLDEPFAGIDPITVQNIQSIIRTLREDGISILITDHAARRNSAGDGPLLRHQQGNRALQRTSGGHQATPRGAAHLPGRYRRRRNRSPAAASPCRSTAAPRRSFGRRGSAQKPPSDDMSDSDD